MNSFRIKLSKVTILPFSFLLQLPLRNWKLCFLILSLHKKFYFLTLFTTPNSSIYPEWFHSGSEWIHSVLEWIHTVPEYIHSGLTFLIVHSAQHDPGHRVCCCWTRDRQRQLCLKSEPSPWHNSTAPAGVTSRHRHTPTHHPTPEWSRVFQFRQQQGSCQCQNWLKQWVFHLYQRQSCFQVAKLMWPRNSARSLSPLCPDCQS